MQSERKVGTFQQLKQAVGIAFKKEKRMRSAALFDWDERELRELEKLSCTTDATGLMVFKQYRHIVYFGECSYGLAVTPGNNVSGNPSCEWQLGHFGND